MKPNKNNVDKLVASLMPDSDKKMGTIASTSILVALSLCFLASTYERMIDNVIFEKSEAEQLTTSLKIMEQKEEKKTPPIEKKQKLPDEKRKHVGGGGKPAGKGNPRAPINRGVLKELTARTNNVNAMAYTLMKEVVAKDIDKILKHTNGLQTTGKTRIGELRGKVDGAFNEGIAAGGSGGIGNAITGLIGGSAGAIRTKSIGNMKVPSPSDIDMGSGPSSRSASDIMKVVRKRTPGLRHIYNRFLKKNPGFQGKVTLKFTIAPGGDIISIAIVSSTTGYAEFDSDVKNAVSRWTFNKVKSGNTTVTIPFTFSE